MATPPAKTKVKTSDFDDVPARDAELFLIDGSSLAYRSFFALPQEIATADGKPTGALLGFSNMMLKLVADYDPKTVIVAWDLGGETVRKKAFAEYKAQRPPMPDLLSEQWPHFKPLAEGFGFHNISFPEYEADDVIGTLATMAEERGIKTCIVTYDRDAMQLVSDKVVVMMTTKGVSEVSVFTPERVELRFGVRPTQISDLIALRGDTSDNIPGVPGVGEKTAADLLREFDSVETILESIDKISGAKRKENLANNADQARISKELATIVCDLPLDIDLDAVHIGRPDQSKLLGMFQAFEFRTLSRRLTELAESAGEVPNSASTPNGTVSDVPRPDEPLVTARMVSSAELRGFVQEMKSGVPVVVDVQADGSVALAVQIEETPPDGGVTSKWIATLMTTVSGAGEALAGAQVVAFDYKALPKSIIDTTTLSDDALISSYLLQPGRRNLLLGELASEAGIRARLAWAGSDPILERVAQNAARLPLLVERNARDMEQSGAIDLYTNIELPLVRVLSNMERLGVRVDNYRIGEIAAKVTDQIAELKDRTFELAGCEFNIGSPQQLAGVLFETLQLPAQRKGKTGYSTDARVLRDLRDLHPVIPVIEQYRELTKLKNTYLDALPALINPKTGRIHTTFSQVTAATGRLSSVNPNLQNIPVRTPLGREIRSAFIPRDGAVFVSCDYSQVELRLLAHVSGEPKLREVFERGEDVHLATAAEVAGVELSQVTREQRSAAKAINFGIIYGISAFGLAGQLQISREEAQQYIDRYLGRYPMVSDFIERTIEDAKEQGFVTTLFGRRRPIPELKSRSFTTRQLGERLAVNTVLQGTAADIMKVAMISADRRIRAELGGRSQIVLQIHDELLVEAAQDQVKDVIDIVRVEMVSAFDMQPALSVDAGTGANWLDAH